jgi:transposase
LDVSLEQTNVCVLDAGGAVTFEGKVPSTPEAIAACVAHHAPAAVTVAFETGPLSTWHYHALVALEVPVMCLDARHARAALSLRLNKTDRNDARGIAELARVGWCREARVKSLASHRVRGLLSARGRLTRMRRDLENQVRGITRTFGVLVGKGSGAVFARRVRLLIGDDGALAAIVEPLLAVQATVLAELAELDAAVLGAARDDATCRRLMTVPGVGPITALTFVVTIDDAARFASSADVGAYLGLTPRRHQSGEVDRGGRISKCGDATLRALLYDAAHVLLSRVKRDSDLRSWGVALARRIGAKKAKVAVARKLAVVLHAIWTDGTIFEATPNAAAAR